MTHRWQKLGLLYCPSSDRRHPKLLSHAANPLPVHMVGDIYRVYFSGRDALKRSSVGAVDVDIVKRQVVKEHAEPFFEHGPAGSFYADGVSVGNCYDDSGGRKHMLFMGWQNPSDAHWRGDIGRLQVGGDFGLTMVDAQPLLASDATDPLGLSYPWVMRAGADAPPDALFDMWYGSTLNWDAGNGEMLHVIQHSRSADGAHWEKEGLAVPFEIGVAQAYSRPTVVRDAHGLHMWFSYRGKVGQTYRIGYAFCPPGGSWELRLADTGIDVSSDGWDCEMIEYPFVFEHGGLRYMLYNGNGYGRSGFGLAVAGRE
ncbi:MAG: hypothetical protein H7255_07885 [Ramlibacter sp.]|nr:hypothetical protein [Ramlibacter sp.]